IRCDPLKSNSDVIQECLPEQENSTDFKFGTKCRARCSENGYRLLGPHTRECLILGIWSGYTQFCIVNNETTTQVMTNTTSMTPLITTMTSYQDVSSLILFGQLFHGYITRLEIWNEIIVEQHLLVSYRDCRKQNGDIFSWSKIPENIETDTKKLKSSLFCSGKKFIVFS
ncbi:unnamed protein product, partial [Adineta steineri]